MGDKSGIEWTDATWNPVTGCSKVSQGCKNCYAERDWARLGHLPAYTGRSFSDVRNHPDRLDQPFRWGKPRRIFVNSMSDLFHPDVPFQFIADVFAAMSATTRHTYQVLTKRPERMLEFFAWLTYEGGPCFGWPIQIDPGRVWPQWKPYREGKQAGYDNCGPGWPLENVWLGVSIEDQATANERIPLLLKAPAEIRWVSAEPLLGPIDLTNCEHPNHSVMADYLQGTDSRTGVDSGTVNWVVVGGESGPKARPMHPQWARSLRDQCRAACVPFLFKQHGEWIHDDDIDNCGLRAPEIADAGQYFNTFDWPHENTESYRVGKKAAGRLLDGVQYDGYPQVSA